MAEIKYPQVEVKLVGEDGNALAIVGRVKKAMRRAGLSQAQQSEYANEALAEDYGDVLRTTMSYVTCDPEEDDDDDDDDQY